MTPPSLLIRGGTIYDGLGNPPERLDLLVEGNTIVDLPARGSATVADRVIDAEGLAVAPGFIDIHSHSDLAVLHPAARDLMAPFVAQGITTQAIGNCGLGVAPAPRSRRDHLLAFMALLVPARFESVGIRWTSCRDYFAALATAHLPLNVAPLAAHGALRCAVMGAKSGPARGSDLKRIGQALDEALNAGALGLSAGLIYPPGMWADTDELEALCRRVAAVDGLFACHVRGSSELAVHAQRELLQLGKNTGTSLQHSHHEAFGPGYWHLVDETMRLEDDARAAGVDVASDVIPYHAVNTTLLSIYPPWALEGGVEALCLRLRDETTRHRIAAEIEGRKPLWPPWRDGWAHNLIRAGGWDNVFVLQAANPAYSRWLGRSLSAVAAAEGSSPFECAARLTQACGGDVMARYHGVTGAPGDDGRLRSLIAHPDNAIGVDVILNGDGVSHPGGHGAMPRVLGTYSRERGWLSLSQAIRKITSLPAARLGITDRGRLAPGRAADIVLFDPLTVGERGTFEHPDRPPRGIEWVVLNGRVAMEAGRLTSLSGSSARGYLLRRGSWKGARAEPLPASQ